MAPNLRGSPVKSRRQLELENFSNAQRLFKRGNGSPPRKHNALEDQLLTKLSMPLLNRPKLLVAFCDCVSTWHSCAANLNEELLPKEPPPSAQALDQYESTSSTVSPSLLGDDDWDEVDRQLQLESQSQAPDRQLQLEPQSRPRVTTVAIPIAVVVAVAVAVAVPFEVAVGQGK
jgi:hypothetical protein